MKRFTHDRILFWVGLLGLAFYVISPLLFPGVALRQPELLPVYTAMIGLGEYLKKGDDDDNDKPNISVNID